MCGRDDAAWLVWAAGEPEAVLSDVALSALVANGHLRNALDGQVGWSEDPAALTRLGERDVIGWQVFVR